MSRLSAQSGGYIVSKPFLEMVSVAHCGRI